MGSGASVGVRDMLKKNTEIKIEIDDSGAWRAMSPDYEGWKAEGKESFGCGEKAAKDLEKWSQMRTCPVCGRRYSAPPAMSRKGLGDICPVCGAAEAVEFLEEREKVMAEIEKREIEAGRVEPIQV